MVTVLSNPQIKGLDEVNHFVVFDDEQQVDES
jgi:hypothetical protein